MCALIILAAAAWAASDIDPAHKSAWSEGAGWLNWQHDCPAPGDGAIVNDTHLAVYVWAENAGWINLGDGDPGAPGGNEAQYANLDGSDFGVNIDAQTGELFGLAWGENIGWVNFAGGASAQPPNAARLDFEACRMRGFAWTENLGWINLDHALFFVALTAQACGASCPGDFDADGDIDQSDLGVLLANYGCIASCAGDADGDGDVDQSDLGLLLGVFGEVCD
jgi:hypothetical protein